LQGRRWHSAALRVSFAVLFPFDGFRSRAFREISSEIEYQQFFRLRELGADAVLVTRRAEKPSLVEIMPVAHEDVRSIPQPSFPLFFLIL